MAAMSHHISRVCGLDILTSQFTRHADSQPTDRAQGLVYSSSRVHLQIKKAVTGQSYAHCKSIITIRC